MDNAIKIDILMATFNGEKYIKELLDSIFWQTISNWQIIIRDDGSIDNTLNIIDEYGNKYPNKVFLIKDEKGRLGSTLSFASLLEISKNDYIMLCDQDDVWMNTKIDTTLKKMEDLEMKYGDIPLMVFTDLRAVDENLRIISESFIKSQKLDTSIIANPTKLAAMNVVAGCTCMINRTATKFVLPIVSKNITHDQWMAINIAYYGKIGFIPIPTILYRQHSYNVLGAYNIGWKYFHNKMKSPLKQFRIYKDLLSDLSFNINVFCFVWYKILFSIKRIF